MSSSILKAFRPETNVKAPPKRSKRSRRKTSPSVSQDLQSPKLYRCCDMENAEQLNVAGGLVAVYSSRCPGKMSSNEDSAALYPILNNVGVLAVADGLGGVRAGEEASALIMKSLRRSIFQVGKDVGKLRGAILDGLEEANRSIQQLGIGTASTIATVEIQGNTVRSYHVGDSMILVCGGRGKIKQQTVSHSPVGFALEAGILDEHEAMYHEDRHLVSNVVGAPDMRIEIGPTIKFNLRDTLLLASDGLADNMHIDEIVETIRKGPLKKSVDQLIQTARKRMLNRNSGKPSKPDDLTVIAYRPSGR